MFVCGQMHSRYRPRVSWWSVQRSVPTVTPISLRTAVIINDTSGPTRVRFSSTFISDKHTCGSIIVGVECFRFWCICCLGLHLSCLLAVLQQGGLDCKHSRNIEKRTWPDGQVSQKWGKQTNQKRHTYICCCIFLKDEETLCLSAFAAFKLCYC